MDIKVNSQTESALAAQRAEKIKTGKKKGFWANLIGKPTSPGNTTSPHSTQLAIIKSAKESDVPLADEQKSISDFDASRAAR